MKIHDERNASRAFTLIDALIIITGLVVLAVLMLPRLGHRHRVPASRISCVNNLKQVGLAFQIWAGDNGDMYPMSLSTNQGGAMELALQGDAVLSFRVMSNELSTPKILVCPSDSKRDYATNFSSGLTRENISYFVGVDAVETNVMMLLAGDRNITNGMRLARGLLELTTNRLTGWTREIHQDAGNIALADGSVQQLSSVGLRAAIATSGVETNRLAIP